LKLNRISWRMRGSAERMVRSCTTASSLWLESSLSAWLD
jgi:hypothetical protein